MDNRAAGLAGALLAVVLVVIGGVWLFSGSSRFEPGVPYEFTYTYKGTAPVVVGQDENGEDIVVSVETRSFVIDQTTTVPVLELGPRKERAADRDNNLAPNTFVFEYKRVPEVKVGGEVVQDEYTFRETRYNIRQEEEQRLVPHLRPSTQ